MKESKSETRDLELDRLVFFSDAVVAIAITLLALDLKIEPAVQAMFPLLTSVMDGRNFSPSHFHF